MTTDSESLRPMPMSPRQAPAEYVNAVILWVRSRRGRAIAITAVLIFVMLVLVGARNSEVGVADGRPYGCGGRIIRMQGTTTCSGSTTTYMPICRL
jgi:hypothetical protein